MALMDLEMYMERKGGSIGSGIGETQGRSDYPRHREDETPCSGCCHGHSTCNTPEMAAAPSQDAL